MALVGEVVARFKAETSDYLSKSEAAKAKNRELAASFLSTAGSAEKAIASLQIAKRTKSLGEFGLDPRQVSGIITEIKALNKEMLDAGKTADDLGDALAKSAKRAGGFGDLQDSFSRFASGDFLGAFEKIKKGLGDLEETKGVGGVGIKAALTLTVMGMVGSALEKATGRAVELQRQFEEGSISAGELTENLLKTIPVLGSIWSAGRNIRELIGLENNDIEKQIALQERLLGLRQAVVDASNQRVKDEATRGRDTQAIEEENAAKRLEGLGFKNQASDKRIRESTNKAIEDFRREQQEALKQQQAALAAKLTIPAKEGEKSIRESLAAAENAYRETQDRIKAAQDALADLGPTNGDEHKLVERAALQDQLNAATKEQAAAQEAISKYQNEINANAKERKLLEEGVNRDIEARTKALKEQEKLNLFAAFNGQTPQKLDNDAFVKSILASVKAGLDGNKPITEWFDKQLSPQAIAAVMGTNPLGRLFQDEQANVDLKINADGKLESWIEQQDGEVKVSVVPDGTDLNEWIRQQTGTVPVQVLPKGDDLTEWIKRQGGSVSVAVIPKFTSEWLTSNPITDWVKGNPVSDWLEKQVNTRLQGRSLSDWLKAEFAEGQKEWAKFHAAADKIRESIKTPAMKQGEEIDEAVRLNRMNGQDGRKLLSDADLSTFFKMNERDLLKEQKQVGATERPVYQLPEVKELRGGQTLFVPPNRIDEKNAERLEQIRQLLQQINEKRTDAGIVVEEVS